MPTAMLLALLLQSGACAESRFQGPDGATLSVIVCPLMQPAEGDAAPADAASPDAPPAPVMKGKPQRS